VDRRIVVQRHLDRTASHSRRNLALGPELADDPVVGRNSAVRRPQAAPHQHRAHRARAIESDRVAVIALARDPDAGHARLLVPASVYVWEVAEVDAVGGGDERWDDATLAARGPDGDGGTVEGDDLSGDCAVDRRGRYRRRTECGDDQAADDDRAFRVVPLVPISARLADKMRAGNALR